jgi:hypothetical protein
MLITALVTRLTQISDDGTDRPRHPVLLGLEQPVQQLLVYRFDGFRGRLGADLANGPKLVSSVGHHRFGVGDKAMDRSLASHSGQVIECVSYVSRPEEPQCDLRQSQCLTSAGRNQCW